MKSITHSAAITLNIGLLSLLIMATSGNLTADTEGATSQASTEPAATTAPATTAPTGQLRYLGLGVELRLAMSKHKFKLTVEPKVELGNSDFVSGGVSGLDNNQAPVVIFGQFTWSADILTLKAIQGVFSYAPDGDTRVFKISDNGRVLTNAKGFVLTEQ
jgi:hypothetical protein